MADPTTADPWGAAELDLAAYLQRVGQPERQPSRDALAALHRAHRQTFPFENLDVLLDQHPGVTVAAVQRKFLGGRRGGYCFEHAMLFGAVLDRLGYDVRRHLSRVGHPTDKPRTHLCLVATIDGEAWLCDPGLGWTLLEPMPLHDGSEVEQDGWRFRLTAEQDAGTRTWLLSRWQHDSWEPMHWIDEAVVHPIDVELAHFWTSQQPESHFRSTLIVTGLTARSSILGLSLDGVTLRRPGQATTHELLPTDAHELGRHFSRIGLFPTDAELDRLEARLGDVRRATAN